MSNCLPVRAARKQGNCPREAPPEVPPEVDSPQAKDPPLADKLEILKLRLIQKSAISGEEDLSKLQISQLQINKNL